MKRTFFNKPVQGITEIWYDEPKSLDFFTELIKDNIDAFKINMQNLSKSSDKHTHLNKNKFIEEWFEIYLDWCDVGQEKEI